MKPCDLKNDGGKCEHSDKDFLCATDSWSGNCLQAFENGVVICVNYYSHSQLDVKFGLDNGAKT